MKLTGRLADEPRRGRRRKAVTVPAVDARAERLARRLALAHWIERKIEAGELRNYAHAAAVLGVTRARVSQSLDLISMPADEQERVLASLAPPRPSYPTGES
jgi:predicted XRE-type DNA-binding protein